MKHLISHVLIVLFVASCTAVADDPVDPGIQFKKIISSQMEAFAADDDVAAFAFAAPSIQAMFGKPENFMAMVRVGYPTVYRARSFKFEDYILVHGNYAQPVRIVGPYGRSVLAMYHMEEQPDGSWRIAGVVIRPLQEQQSQSELGTSSRDDCWLIFEDASTTAWGHKRS